MQLWVWQQFESSVQVREKWKDAEEPLSQTSAVLYSANSATSAFYLFCTNETDLLEEVSENAQRINLHVYRKNK